MAGGFFTHAALDNLRRGRSIIPVQKHDKRPYFSLLRATGGTDEWRIYSQRHATEHEIAAWSERSRDRANIGIVMGAVSEIFALDVDYRHGGEKTLRHLTGGRSLSTETVQTADGFHLYFEYPGFAFELSETLPGIDFRSDGSYVVAAPSIHPTKVAYRSLNNLPPMAAPGWLHELITPIVKSADAARLDTLADKTLIHSAHQDSAALPGEYRQVFAKFPRANYPSRSEQDMAVITHLANRGADFERVLEVFCGAPDTHFRRVAQQRGVNAAHKYLLHSYNKAVRLPLAPHRREARLRAALLREVANAHQWAGAAALTDRAVLLAHIDRFDQHGGEPYYLSVREIGNAARTSASTASTSNRRLLAAGFIECVSVGAWGDASTYKIGRRLQEAVGTQDCPVRPSCVSICSINEYPPDSECDTPIELQRVLPDNENAARSDQVLDTHGVFERAILGKAAELIWLAARGQWLTQRNFRDRTGLAQGTVSKKVARLVSIGMLHQQVQEGSGLFAGNTMTGYKANEEFDFKDYAATQGAEEIARIRAFAHREQRYTNFENSLRSQCRSKSKPSKTSSQP